MSMNDTLEQIEKIHVNTDKAIQEMGNRYEGPKHTPYKTNDRAFIQNQVTGQQINSIKTGASTEIHRLANELPTAEKNIEKQRAVDKYGPPGIDKSKDTLNKEFNREAKDHSKSELEKKGSEKTEPSKSAPPATEKSEMNVNQGASAKFYQKEKDQPSPEKATPSANEKQEKNVNNSASSKFYQQEKEQSAPEKEKPQSKEADNKASSKFYSQPSDTHQPKPPDREDR